MAGLNKIMIIGRLGTDPEMRYTQDGKAVTRFRVAVDNPYTTAAGERKQETEWFTVVAWRQLAEQCSQFLAKGRLVYAEGRLRSRSWEGQNKQPRFDMEITADRVVFLDRQPGAQLPGQAEETAAAEGGETAESLPF
ncbi:MAG: single-stranded DNA-binding protein [Chloroflexi bacterium]|nr:single-stranded DNA-binding protein [Chloroflexota bacterium]